MLRTNRFTFSRNKIALLIFFFVATSLLYLCTKLFFYDEDIFVANRHSNFLSNLTRGSIVKFTFLADNFFYNTNAAGYHVTSVLLHLVNTFLAAYTFKTFLEIINVQQLNISKARYIFFFLFLLSPIHSEPLCYLLGRAGLVVTLLCMLSLVFFLKANFKKQELLFVSLIFFLVSLFSYEISWTFPLIILVVTYYLKKRSALKIKLVTGYVAPYFILFVLWFLLKVIYIDRLKIIPYGNNVFSSIDTLRLFKNFIVLFVRNVIPPFKSTILFVALSIIALSLFMYFLLFHKNRNKPLFSFCLLLICVWVLAFLPAIVFGINSHNSESERYIYFSSVFAIMFAAIALSLIRNKRLTLYAAGFVCCAYAYFLFTTISDYIKGGNFSKNYLAVLMKQDSKKENVYLINQPSQYNGALLFRAFGDETGSSKKNLYTINNYMHTLSASKANYITLSKKEISNDVAITNVVVTSIDSLSSVFPEFNFDKPGNFLINSATNDSVSFTKGKNIIVGLKLPEAYVFE